MALTQKLLVGTLTITPRPSTCCAGDPMYQYNVGLKVQLTDLQDPRNWPRNENVYKNVAKEKAQSQASGTFLEVKRFNEEERN